MVYNETDTSVDFRLCQDFSLILSVFSLIYLLVCFPLGLCYNVLLVVVNLSNKVSMTMPDVYFVNMAIAGLVLNLVAPVELLSSTFTRWHAWEYDNEVYITLLILFNISSLVIMYSTTLLSLDYYIERALPRTYMSSVYNTKHVCGFIWGGAVLTSFSSLLFYVCNHISTKMVECSKMQNKEAADAIMMFIGYVVPAVAVLYAFVLRLPPCALTKLFRDLGRCIHLSPGWKRRKLENARVKLHFITHRFLKTNDHLCQSSFVLVFLLSLEALEKFIRTANMTQCMQVDNVLKKKKLNYTH